MNQELVDYIIECLRDGLPEDAIKERILQEGWDKKEVIASFAIAKQLLKGEEIEPDKNKKAKDVPKTPKKNVDLAAKKMEKEYTQKTSSLKTLIVLIILFGIFVAILYFAGLLKIFGI